MTFSELGLSEPLVTAVTERGYSVPTAIQQQAIPPLLAGRDIVASAQTGTGKTASFVLPLLEMLSGPHKRRAKRLRALILVPTRELAVQVRDECARLASGRRVSVVALYGGKPIKQQIDKLNRGAQIVVGTPGRVIDLMNRAALLLGDVRFSVLDFPNI